MEAWSVAEFGAFYVEKRAELQDHALRILKDSARAEEVVQDVFLKVILAAPELKSRDHALAYMHRSIENTCIDIFRMEGRRPRMVVLDEVNAEVEAKWQVDVSHADVIGTADDAAIVRQALAMLSPAERAAVVMWEIEGRSSKEIARELGIKESTVRHTVSRARASLRRILTELVIDESRGLTALDLLSTTYRKTAKAAKNSAKVSLSFILILFAFLGFNSLPSNLGPTISETKESLPQSNFPVSVPLEDQQEDVVNNSSPKQLANSKSKAPVENIKSAELRFPGLDESGSPIGFTVTDSTGSLGTAYFRERAPLFSETELTIGQVFKTDSGAANIFISQFLTTDEMGLSYRPVVSFSQAGRWIPLLTKVISTEVNRQVSGNYLLSAYIAVDSAVDSPIRVVATASGRDLSVAPSQVVVRLLLDPTKTKVLAQAVYVIEKWA